LKFYYNLRGLFWEFRKAPPVFSVIAYINVLVTSDFK